MGVEDLGRNDVIARGRADVTLVRESNRLRRFKVIGVVLAVAAAYVWIRLAFFTPVRLGFPEIPDWIMDYWPMLILVVLIGLVLVAPLLFAGRSPHVLFRPSEIETSFDDVKGMPNVKEEVVRSLNLFLGFKSFRDEMGGKPRQALLFEGPPGTGKTYMAKAMARGAGVPYLFVSASSFQSMYYGQTNRKIRSFFGALRKAAREEGGAIGFIEEFDAIASARGGMKDRASTARSVHGSALMERAGVEWSGINEGVTGVVNELLGQLQSFDQPTTGQWFRGWFVNSANRWLPDARQIPKRPPVTSNILVIGATKGPLEI